MVDHNWDMQPKNIARSIATAPTSKPARTALFLPGGQMLCVKQALADGTINNRTFNIYVERCNRVAEQIRRTHARLRLTRGCIIHDRDIADLDLATILHNRVLDYSFIDSCTTITRDLAEWLRYVLPQHVAIGGTVAVTLVRQPRAERFAFDMASLLHRGGFGRELCRSSQEMIRQATCVGNTEWSPQPSVSEHTHPRRRKFTWSGDLSPRFHDSSVKLLSILRMLWSEYTFKLEACIEYKNDVSTPSGSRMVMFRFGGFRPAGRRHLERFRDWHPAVDAALTMGIG